MHCMPSIVTLPIYEGFNHFAIWPDIQMNDNYSLLSRTNVHVAKFKDMFITLPYYKGYHYVAYMSPNGNMDNTASLFDEKPKFLAQYKFRKDGLIAKDKTCECSNISFGSVKEVFQDGSVKYEDHSLECIEMEEQKLDSYKGLDDSSSDLVSLQLNFQNKIVELNAENHMDMEKVKEIFCEIYNLNKTRVKFLVDGTYLSDDFLVKTLVQSDLPTIDIFMEQRGGGPSRKKGLTGYEVNNLLDEMSPEKIESKTNLVYNREDSMVDIVELEYDQNNDPEFECCFTDKEHIEDMDNEQEKEKETENEWILKLRTKYDIHQDNMSEYDKKISYYLLLPTLQPIDEIALKNIVEMKEKYEDLFGDTKMERKKLSKERGKKRKVPLHKNLYKKFRQYASCEKLQLPKVNKLCKKYNKTNISEIGDQVKHILAEKDQNTVNIISNHGNVKKTEFKKKTITKRKLNFAPNQGNGVESTDIRNTPKRKKLSEYEENPSPSKAELKLKVKMLENQINKLGKFKLPHEVSEDSNNNNIKKVVKVSKLFECDVDGCTKRYSTGFGLDRHKVSSHEGANNNQKEKRMCPYCGKWTVYVDQHMKTHEEIYKTNVCEICKINVPFNMQKHRGSCIKCPFCDFTNKKKKRLLGHIKKNHENIDVQQNEPLDLSSPLKNLDTIKDYSKEETDVTRDIQLHVVPSAEASLINNNDILSNKITNMSQESYVDQYEKNKKENIIKENNIKQKKDRLDVSLNKKQSQYPFDNSSDDEAYISELEDGDSEIYTFNRRVGKDEVRNDLRKIDSERSLECNEKEQLLAKFGQFMDNKNDKADKEKGNHGKKNNSTSNQYVRALRTFFLPACYIKIQPFNPSWFLDCTTQKYFTVDGLKRLLDPNEPVHITSKIIEASLKVCCEKGGSGATKVILLAAIIQFMNFVQLEFDENVDIFGHEISNKIGMYHNKAKNYITSLSLWSKYNRQTNTEHRKNVLRKDLKHPNRSGEVTLKYKRYLQSNERINNIIKVRQIAESDEIPTSSQLVECSNIVIGELIASTGKRPVVVRSMTVGDYFDKKPGFNPYDITEEDCVLDERKGSDEIYRRIDPNTPPKHRACIHQIESNSVECPVSCEDRCDPDGFNILVTKDKTKGDSYLHIASWIKDFMDWWELIKSRYFSNWETNDDFEAGWYENDEALFFLNSNGSALQAINLSHISKVMDIDITSYDFRKIVSTWALNHDLKEIRDAEEEALQHSVTVAKDRYMLNKQYKPQRLTQKYIAEENLFSKTIQKEVDKIKIKTANLIKQKEAQRKQQRLENLNKEYQQQKLFKEDHKSLGPRHRIYRKDLKEFIRVLEDIDGCHIKTTLKMTKTALTWRNYIVRKVCSTEGIHGLELRQIWKSIYRGDLKWGVRDMRRKAKENDWPRNMRFVGRDRNSWIAYSIKKSCDLFVKEQTVSKSQNS